MDTEVETTPSGKTSYSYVLYVPRASHNYPELELAIKRTAVHAFEAKADADGFKPYGEIEVRWSHWITYDEEGHVNLAADEAGTHRMLVVESLARSKDA